MRSLVIWNGNDIPATLRGRMTTDGAHEGMPVVIIRKRTGWAALRLAEIWRFRDLLYFLTWRDLKVRYKQTALGVVWVVLQPLVMMLAFTVIFHRLGRMPSADVPYPLFALAALLPWQLFSRALTDAGHSLVANERLVTKVYFPRVLIPCATVLAALADFAIALLVLIGAMAFYGHAPTLAVLALPLFLLLALVAALGLGLWLSALDVRYRDVRYVIPFLTQLWFFATPIVYPARLVPEPWDVVYALNPMVGVVEGFRWALLDTPPPSESVAISAAVATVMFVGGLIYFRRTERTFADTV